MRRADVLALAARVEALTGPDRAVDTEIEAARGWPDVQWTGAARRYTASLDAAASLVPAGWGYILHHYPDGSANAFVYESQDDTHNPVGGATPALALTAAALRAIAEGMSDEG